MSTHDDITRRWIDRELGRTKRPNIGGRNANVIAVDGALYSYGRHFELARPLKKKNAGQAHANDVVGWLLNGDRYSVTTTRHQSVVRNAVARTGLPVVIIPHEALRAAGIDMDTITIVEVTDDRHETIEHKSSTVPDGVRYVVEDVHATVELSAEELQAIADKKTAYNHRRWTEQHTWAREEDGASTYWRNWATRPENINPPAFVTIDDLAQYEKTEWRKTGTRTVMYLGRSRTVVSEVTENGQTSYRWTTYRHWLGASLIRAAVRTGPGTRRRRWAYFLSAFDDQESRPLYFIAELPRGVHPATVAEAFDALKPDVVKVAEQMGRDVTRQGDIFAVAMPGLTLRDLRKDGATVERGPRITEIWRYRDRYTALGAIPSADDETTWHDEDGPGRIREHVETIDRGRGWRALLEQNHYATEVARMSDGTTFARGTLKHDPMGRAADHARRKMGDGKTWHLIVKNTVPLSK